MKNKYIRGGNTGFRHNILLFKGQNLFFQELPYSEILPSSNKFNCLTYPTEYDGNCS